MDPAPCARLSDGDRKSGCRHVSGLSVEPRRVPGHDGKSAHLPLIRPSASQALHPSRFGRRRSDRFAISSVDNPRNLAAGFLRPAAQAAAGMRYSSARVSNAHNTRAFLLAKATAAMFGPRRSLSVATQRLCESRFRAVWRRVVRAP